MSIVFQNVTRALGRLLLLSVLLFFGVYRWLSHDLVWCLVLSCVLSFPLLLIGEITHVFRSTPILPGAKGFRFGRLLPEQNTASTMDTLRILVIGDSMAEGVGVGDVHQGAPMRIIHFLRSSLDQAYQQHHSHSHQIDTISSSQVPVMIEYLIIARSGYTSSKMRQRLLKYLPENFADGTLRLSPPPPTDDMSVEEITRHLPQMEARPSDDPTRKGQTQTIVILFNGANEATRLYRRQTVQKSTQALIDALRHKLATSSSQTTQSHTHTHPLHLSSSIPLIHIGMPPLWLFPALPPLMRTIIGWKAKRIEKHMRKFHDPSAGFIYLHMPDLSASAALLHSTRLKQNDQLNANDTPHPRVSDAMNGKIPSSLDELQSSPFESPLPLLHQVTQFSTSPEAALTRLFARDAFHLGPIGIEAWSVAAETQIRQGLVQWCEAQAKTHTHACWKLMKQAQWHIVRENPY